MYIPDNIEQIHTKYQKLHLEENEQNHKATHTWEKKPIKHIINYSIIKLINA